MSFLLTFECSQNIYSSEPSPPENFHVLQKKNLTFKWDKPSCVPGKLQYYYIYLSWKPLYPIPDAPLCHPPRKNRISIDASETNYTWLDWEGFSYYTAYMRAETKGGRSPPELSTSIYFDIRNARGNYLWKN